MADKHFIDARPPMGLRRRLKLHSPFATVRARVLLAVWVTLTLGVLAFVLAADLGRAKARVEHLGNDFLHHVADRALISETAIEGFAAFIASMGELDHDRAQAYARMLLGRYPFLYMLEMDPENWTAR